MMSGDGLDPLLGGASEEAGGSDEDRGSNFYEGEEYGQGEMASFANDEQDYDEQVVLKSTSAWEEVREMVILAAGIVVSRCSWVMIKMTDTALIGKKDTAALESSSAADLWMSSVGVLTMGGVLGIFVGQAAGAGNYQLGSIWFQVSLVTIALITAPVMVLWFFTGDIVRLFGLDSSMLEFATYYGRVLSLCLPARSLMGQVSQYCSAYGIVRPEAHISMFAAVFNLICGLIFVFGLGIPHWNGLGARACPWVTTGTEYTQLWLFWVLYGLVWPLYENLHWTGWTLSEVTSERVCRYLYLYIPTAFSLASDFWRMSVIGVFAAELGAMDLAVFTASYRILWLALTVVGAMSFAVRVRLSIFLGAADITSSMRSVKVGVLFTTGLLLTVTIAVYLLIDPLARVFSSDPEFIKTFVDARVSFCCVLISMNLAVFLEQIPMAMGKARAVFLVGVVGSWLGQVPASYLAVHYWKHSLDGLFYGMAFGYTLLVLCLGGVIASTNWGEVIDDAQTRSEVQAETSH
mmetsp:Transcript_5263/g.8079  ORF Transcript_5263/g.8079 Transcript_5263/m.8079 type:complete len:519 (-) Transcript_5263:1698-3254(-)